MHRALGAGYPDGFQGFDQRFGFEAASLIGRLCEGFDAEISALTEIGENAIPLGPDAADTGLAGQAREEVAIFIASYGHEIGVTGIKVGTNFRR